MMHPLLAKAADLCKLPLTKVRRAFPAELTVWVRNVSVCPRVFNAKIEFCVEEKKNTNRSVKNLFGC